jgi:hypothetical protein
VPALTLSFERRSQLVVNVPDDKLAMQLLLKSQGFLATTITKKGGNEFYRMVFNASAPSML